MCWSRPSPCPSEARHEVGRSTWNMTATPRSPRWDGRSGSLRAHRGAGRVNLPRRKRSSGTAMLHVERRMEGSEAFSWRRLSEGHIGIAALSTGERRRRPFRQRRGRALLLHVEHRHGQPPPASPSPDPDRELLPSDGAHTKRPGHDRRGNHWPDPRTRASLHVEQSAVSCRVSGGPASSCSNEAPTHGSAHLPAPATSTKRKALVSGRNGKGDHCDGEPPTGGCCDSARFHVEPGAPLRGQASSDRAS